MIVSASINIKATSEPKLACNQKNEFKNIIDLKNSIIMGDRGYDPLETMLNIIEQQSYFIIRLKDSTFKKERKYLTKQDENVWININNTRLKNAENKQIKEKYIKEGRIKLRIIEINLEKKDNEEQDKEYLITNLTKKWHHMMILKSYIIKDGV